MRDQLAIYILSYRSPHLIDCVSISNQNHQTQDEISRPTSITTQSNSHDDDNTYKAVQQDLTFSLAASHANG